MPVRTVDVHREPSCQLLLRPVHALLYLLSVGCCRAQAGHINTASTSSVEYDQSSKTRWLGIPEQQTTVVSHAEWPRHARLCTKLASYKSSTLQLSCGHTLRVPCGQHQVRRVQVRARQLACDVQYGRLHSRQPGCLFRPAANVQLCALELVIQWLY